MAEILVIFDFDCSLVLEDTDALVLKTLAPDFYDEAISLYHSDHSPYRHQWAALMNYFINRLMNEREVTLDIINSLLITMPVDSEIIESIKLLASHPQRTKMIIISDSNEYYIRIILQHLGIHEYFLRIYTNQVSIYSNEFNQQRLHITAYDSTSAVEHIDSMNKNMNDVDQRRIISNDVCQNLCSRNLCKTKLLQRFLNEFYFHNHIPQILYVGDGMGDYCPVTYLKNEYDIVLCRQDWALHRRLQNSSPIKAKIIPWVDGKVIRQTFESILVGNEEGKVVHEDKEEKG